jgi:sugar phosphate isomerase/epimerase
MTVAGKCSPTPDALAAARDRGFNTVELHLGSWDGDVADATDAVADDAVDAVSVHTPHATPDDRETFRRADRLAAELDASLVVHSQYANHVHVPDLAAVGFESPHGYENNPGASVRHLEAMILSRGHDFVLDTAHLYTAAADYLAAVERLLADWRDRIPVVHLCDSTLTRDGLAFGDGEMAMSDLSGS